MFKIAHPIYGVLSIQNLNKLLKKRVNLNFHIKY